MMHPESVFRFCNTLALLGWIGLILLGRRALIAGLIASVVVPLALAVVYVSLLAAHWGESQGSFNSLAGVASLFSNPWLLLAGWVHYLAFDLFLGCWQVRNAARNNIPHWFVVPCLILTFLFGPAGLLAYFLLRFARTRHFAISEEAS